VADEVAEHVDAAGDVLPVEAGDVALVAVAQHLEQQVVLGLGVVEYPGVGHVDLLGDDGPGTGAPASSSPWLAARLPYRDRSSSARVS